MPPLLRSDYPPATRGRVVVWGMLASHPFGGMTWQVLQYVVPLRRLGFDVWYIEESDRPILDPVQCWPTTDYMSNVDHLARHMDSVGLGDRWVYRPPESDSEVYGARDIDGLARLYAESDAVLNICGAQELRPEHVDIPCLVYVQTDPAADQVKLASGDEGKRQEIDSYTYLFTYGENIGRRGCGIPTAGREWFPTRPPVCIDWWEDAGPPAATAALTTITNWKSFPDKDVQWNGRTWRWNKQDEIRRFIRLPQRAALPLAMAISAIGEDDQALLRDQGWHLTPATALTDPYDYRDYIRDSLGEFTVAKEQYTLPRSGWFSDRSVCYLAAGRPVITQDTGFGDNITGEYGLFAYSTEDEARAAIEAVATDYERHAAGAREIALEFFAAERVVAGMAARIGLL